RCTPWPGSPPGRTRPSRPSGGSSARRTGRRAAGPREMPPGGSAPEPVPWRGEVVVRGGRPRPDPGAAGQVGAAVASSRRQPIATRPKRVTPEGGSTMRKFLWALPAAAAARAAAAAAALAAAVGLNPAGVAAPRGGAGGAAAAALPVTRVVLFSSGVGYF